MTRAFEIYAEHGPTASKAFVSANAVRQLGCCKMQRGVTEIISVTSSGAGHPSSMQVHRARLGCFPMGAVAPNLARERECRPSTLAGDQNLPHVAHG
jgi:hypothetical protein